ncbi:MAG: hypothetical protein RL268_482 [Pseudomonadota bacterium]|jgi:hypothetical protein
MTEATAPALAADMAASDDMSEDAAMEAAFDRAMALPDDPAEAQQELAAEAEPEAEPEGESLAEVIEEVPSDIPARLRDVWSKMEPEAREAVISEQRDLSRKLADQGRLMQGIAPIRDALVQAAREMPNLAGLTPQQVAGEVFELAKISRQFQEKPVETLLGLIQKHNIGPQVAQALGGKVPDGASESAALQREITTLKQQIQGMSDPTRVQQMVDATISQRSVLDEVSRFSGAAKHWGAVENFIPALIPAIRQKLGEGASAQDVLSQAYELAVSIHLPDAKAQPQAAVTSLPAVAPEKAEAVRNAKSVNVTSRLTGQARTLSEDEVLGEAYERAQRKR